MTDQKTILFHAPTTSIEEYEKLAEQAERLKPYGRVLMLAGCLADKWFSCLPEQGSPWHEYASYNPTFFNVFPHEKLRPHLDMAFVERNRAFLAAQREVLRKHGLEAWFYAVEPSFVPDSFFIAHPRLRGPRVDHPRRATVEAFAMCIDLPEVRELYRSMTAELVRNCPEIAAITFKVNDAGSGFCWADALYMGPNGPQHCRHRSAADRFVDFTQTMQQGAKDAGREGLLVYNTASNWWGGELAQINARMPADTMVLPGNPDVLNLGGMGGATYPVLGLMDPLRIFRTMEKWNDPAKKTAFFHFRVSYDRAHEKLDTVAKVIDLFEDSAKAPTSGWLSQIEKLRKVGKGWAGEDKGDDLARAFVELDEAARLVNVVCAGARPMYAGVSMRHITRPLMIRPRELSWEEDEYFVPHIFNNRMGEAIDDYIDLHGGRMHMDMADHYYSPSFMAGVKALRDAAESFERCATGPEAKWIGDGALALRMWSSILRSSHNFYCVQRIRDDYAEVLAGEKVKWEKKGTRTGHPAVQPYYYLLRDELDNTAELIALLEKGGLERIKTAADPEHEDTFVLGGDLVDQLRTKIRLMRRHWRDAEWWLAPPHK